MIKINLDPTRVSKLNLMNIRIIVSRNIHLVDIGRLATQGLDGFGRAVELVRGQVEAEVELSDAVVAFAAARQPVGLEGRDDGLADVLVALVLEMERSEMLVDTINVQVSLKLTFT